MRHVWVGFVLTLICITTVSSAGVTISPDILYQNYPVTISYSGVTDGTSMAIGFENNFTSGASGSYGIMSSSLTLPMTLNPGTFTSVDGSLLSTSSYISDTTGQVASGTYGVRVIKTITTPGTGTNLSWMVNGTKSGSNSGEITFYPTFNPKQGYLNVTVTIGSSVVSKLIPYNQNLAPPSVQVESVSVPSGQTRYANVSITGLTGGLSNYNLTVVLPTSGVGNFTNVSVPGSVTLQSKYNTSYTLGVNATSSLTGSVSLPQALNISYLGAAYGQSSINVTVNALKNSAGASISPILITNGTLTVPTPPVPGANFTGTPQSGIVPFNVSFIYTSGDSPSGYDWQFGDNTANSTQQNPTHTYLVAGSHGVNLTTYGAVENNTNVVPGYIQASQLAVWFMGNVTSGPHPLSVNFTGLSSTPYTSWVYSFGDGQSAALANVTHTYSSPGVYSVRAQAISGSAKNGAIRNQYIRVT